MSLPKTETYTIDDIYRLPEGERAELIAGRLYMTVPPSRIHQEIAGSIYSEIKQYIRNQKGICQPYIAPFAVYLDENNETYVEPDIAVVCDKNKLNDKGCLGAPDLIIEIVSPSSKKLDYYTKLVLYRDAGVREYWIVDPTRETILVYLLEQNEAPVIYRFTDMIKVNIFDDLNIMLENLLEE